MDLAALDGAQIDPADDPGPPKPIVRHNLHDAIVSRIRDMIIDGTLAPGTRIHEGNLGQGLGVSRTPLREALKYLASEGLLELAPGRGAVVRNFSAKDVQDSLIVLASLEDTAGRLACAHASDDQIRDIRRMHDEMMQRYSVRDRLSYFKLNQNIHSAILKASGNEPLADVHGMLQARLRRIRYVGNESPEKWAAAVADHEDMIAALEARDGERLATALTDHMQNTWHRVRGSI
jgi:DNA-binding GntR family transcriptional regulator